MIAVNQDSGYFQKEEGWVLFLFLFFLNEILQCFWFG